MTARLLVKGGCVVVRMMKGCANDEMMINKFEEDSSRAENAHLKVQRAEAHANEGADPDLL